MICVCKFETKPVTVVLHKRVSPLVSAGSLHSWVSPHADSKDLLERESGEKRKEEGGERERERERESTSTANHTTRERRAKGRGKEKEGEAL